MKIVLTGGIASGKTLATEYLKKKGFTVIDADLVSRDVARHDSRVRQRVSDEFGARFVTQDGFDRRALRDYVFPDPELVRALDEILHPAIYAEMQRRLDAASGDVVVAVPLWFESGEGLVGIDEVWTVTAPEVLRIKRLLSRDTIGEDAARAILAAQTDDDVRIARSDRVFVNDATEQALYQRIDAALKE